MAYRWLIFLLVATVVGWGCDSGGSPPPPPPPPPPAPQPPPNIVLIMADDLGYETLGANGGLSYETPNLDALARTGMRFTQGYATPLCTPSRVQIMTGQYNFRNYVGFGLLDPDQQTFAHLLRDAGYRTAVTGKWQLYGTPEQRARFGRPGAHPLEAGFDEFLVWQIEVAGSRYKAPFLYTNNLPAQTYPDAYGPDLFADFIDRFLEDNQDQPFFLYYPMALPHKPYHPPPDHPDYPAYDPDSDASDARYFKDDLAYLDKLVGRVVEQLDRLGLRENTLVLFTGDNGTGAEIVSQLGDRTIRGAKGFTTEAGTHVPLIANWPGVIAPGRVNDNLIDFTDFLPTLLNVAQATPAPFTDGLSFYPQLIGTADSTRSWIFCHYDSGTRPRQRYVQDREWKLYDDGLFYNVAADPEETRPLSDGELTPEALQRKQSFQAVLDRMQ